MDSPCEGSYKLTCDGVVSKNGVVVCGGVLQNHLGAMAFSFVQNLGGYSIVQI